MEISFTLYSRFKFKSANLAREGLRTLVVAKKVLSEEQLAQFDVSVSKFECVIVFPHKQYIYFSYRKSINKLN